MAWVPSRKALDVRECPLNPAVVMAAGLPSRQE